MNDFFKNEKELVANAGRAYTKLQGYNSEQSLWTLLLQASDECAVPACGGSWYSNGRYEEIQTNKIPPANKLLIPSFIKHILSLIDKNKYENLYHIHFYLYDILSFFKLQYFMYTPSWHLYDIFI